MRVNETVKHGSMSIVRHIEWVQCVPENIFKMLYQMCTEAYQSSKLLIGGHYYDKTEEMEMNLVHQIH
jgi:hypothetical protein